MNPWNRLKQAKIGSWAVLAIMVVGVIFLSGFEYRMVIASQQSGLIPEMTPGPTVPVITSSPTKPVSPVTPGKGNGPILGIDGNPDLYYPGIPWVRLSYPTCGWGNLQGSVLKQTIQDYHQQGIHVLLIVCQNSSTGPKLFNTQWLNDAAQGNADTVQCGNEQMKYDPPSTLYVSPQNFARFYDLCERAVHTVNPNTSVLLGSLDPHVGGVDYAPLMSQVQYLNQMQSAMNSTVHPGGHWDWHTQILGLIDSWHNGYPDASVNSLYNLFLFWAQQFHVEASAVGKHLWVIEGTGCFQGCGLDPTNAYQIAVSHILTLITDVTTAMRYHVPFFYFSSEDFALQGVYWPIGILDIQGQPKPLRQDLPMGARKLVMTCSTGKQTVINQEQLLSSLYAGCSLPSNYVDILVS
jgi:hypothetical protein